MIWFLLGILVGLAAGYAFVRRRRQDERFLSTNEYWVYLPTDRGPNQALLMKNLLSRSGPVTQREGLLFSDIRLHVALVLKSKNPHVFRPDLFEAHIEPTAEMLSILAEATSLVKVRYISERPLLDLASVQLLPHLALAVADDGEGRLIYDCVKEELSTVESFRAMVKRDSDLTKGVDQVRAIWKVAEVGGWGETRGLRKIGLPELTTAPMEADERVLVTDLLELAAAKLWGARARLDSVRVDLFGDEFEIVTSPARNQRSAVRILRIQTSA